jgi:hypothetical protein
MVTSNVSALAAIAAGESARLSAVTVNPAISASRLVIIATSCEM